MANLWRIQPGSRLSSTTLFKKTSADNRQTIANTFFGQSTTYSGILRRWNGTAWIKGSLKVFLSGTWQKKPLKRWNGTTWVQVDATGI